MKNEDTQSPSESIEILNGPQLTRQVREENSKLQEMNKEIKIQPEPR